MDFTKNLIKPHKNIWPIQRKFCLLFQILLSNQADGFVWRRTFLWVRPQNNEQQNIWLIQAKVGANCTK